LQAKPYLEAIGKGVLDVGDRTRSSGALKLIGNFFVSSMIELIAEGTALADKNDIPQSALLEVLNLLYPSPIVEVS
jgi:3-hydroxyisobutyrate dehydrogenase-like beta-hydroxyacid dehydrogenase